MPKRKVKAKTMKLINGDALQELDKLKSNSIDLVLIDPPYGYLNHKIETDVNIESVVKKLDRVLKPDGVFMYFGKMPYINSWFNEVEKYRPFKQEIIWDKNNGASPTARVLQCHENVYIHSINPLNETYVSLKMTSLYGYKDVKWLVRYLSELSGILKRPERLREFANILENKSDGITNKVATRYGEGSILSTTFKKSKNWVGIIKRLRRGYKAMSVVRFASHNQIPSNEKVKHPTVKSVPLVQYLITLGSNKGDVVLDCFLGSGTTGIASVIEEREFIGIELDKSYFEIASKRIEQVQILKESMLEL